jgi:sphingomyelin phosphodiesterase acid-like 3
VGNNDSYTGDYNIIPNGVFLHDTANAWSTLIKDNDNRKSFNASFPVGGYYAVNLPGTKKQKLIVLNSVLFSTKITGPRVDQAAQAELTWLNFQLTQATQQHQAVLLAYHIPMGVNIYAMLKHLFGGFNEFWQAKYNSAFKKVLQDYAGTVKGVLAGHLHVDNFQQIKLSSGVEIPVSVTQAISPIYGNDPGFKIYTFNANNLELIYCDLYIYSGNDQQDNSVWLKKYHTTVFSPTTLFLNKLSIPHFLSNWRRVG